MDGGEVKAVLSDHFDAEFVGGKVTTSLDLLGALKEIARDSKNKVDDMIIGWVELALQGKEWHSNARKQLAEVSE